MLNVTLIKPGAGPTQWGTEVGQKWTDVENTFKKVMNQHDVFEFFTGL